MNEAETRAEHIDPALARSGWGSVEGSRIRREYEISPGRIEGAGRRGKRVKADYIHEFRNTKLAVVEAKAWDLSLTEGVAQAKDYAGKLAIRFTYSSNGQGVYGNYISGPWLSVIGHLRSRRRLIAPRYTQHRASRHPRE